MASDVPERYEPGQRDPSDADLVARSASGDAAAFGVLVRRHVRAATTLAFELLGDRDDAEDVVQDAFIVVLRRAHDFDSTQQFSRWFFGIVRNTARRRGGLAARRRRLLDRWSADARSASASSTAGAPGEGESAHDEMVARVADVVGGLSEMQRRCFTLQVTHGIPVSEVAAMLDIAESTVRQHVFRARAVLREKLGNMKFE